MYDIFLVLHLLGMAGGVGTSLFMAGLNIRAEKLPGNEAGTLMGNASIVARHLSSVSLALLWLSGIAMIAMAEGLATSGGNFFIAKVALVILLTILIGLIHRADGRIRRNENAEAAQAQIKPMSMAALLISVSVVILAVAAFE